MTGNQKKVTELESVGHCHDKDINIFEVSLILAALAKPNIDIDHYHAQSRKIIDDLGKNFEILCGKMNGDTARVQAAALEKTFAIEHGFLGDDIHYDDLKNINMCDAMDRRLGLPITLCILAIHVCRANGWNAEGVNFPGHFLMRLEKDGERILIDPFQGCKILDAKDLRIILKRILGAGAELSADYYVPCSNREILLRLQNNIKYRLIDVLDYEGALACVETMTQIAPDDYRLSLDKAVLLSRLDQPIAAIGYLEHYITRVTNPKDRMDAEDFMRQLQNSIN
jgi:regulator of sirC expression with transglutaminase-like and TPR domain